MNNISNILDGTARGQLKVRVFAFLQRLDASRNTEQEQLQQCVSRVFKCATATGMVSDWINARSTKN